MESVLLDVAGHRRSPATMPGYHRGRPPRNKGEQYPADPPTVEEIVAVMRTVGDRADGYRLRALIVLLWRAGLRISEALSLQESDLDRARGAVLVRRGLCRIRHSPAYAVARVMPSGPYRRSRRRVRRSGRDPGLKASRGPGRRLGPSVYRSRRARAQGHPWSVAAVRGR